MAGKSKWPEASMSETDPLLRAFYGVCYVLICLVSGALVGFLAGWGSHLALDFGSVRSLPLI